MFDRIALTVTKPLVDALVQNGVLPDDNSRHVRSVKASWCEHDKDESGALVIIRKISKQIAA